MLGLLGLFVTYEFLMLRAVNGAIQRVRLLPNWMWLSNILLETLLPGLAVAFLSSASIDLIYRPLANPAGLAFFVFISLSTLRLNPASCRLCGVIAAGSYLAAAAYLGWRPSLSGAHPCFLRKKLSSVMLPPSSLPDLLPPWWQRRSESKSMPHSERQKRDVRWIDWNTTSQWPERYNSLCFHARRPRLRALRSLDGTNLPIRRRDYYDWQLLADGKVLVALADVTGHGIGPALLASVCRAYARANFRVGTGLLEAMEQLNAALAEDIGEGRFVTFVAAVCTPGNSRVELLSAGHGPLFLYLLKEDFFEEMGAQGLPLGVVATMVSEPPQVLELNRGDLLVLVTDGFFEWANSQGELFGPKRLEEVIRISKESNRRNHLRFVSSHDCFLRWHQTTRRSDSGNYQAHVVSSEPAYAHGATGSACNVEGPQAAAYKASARRTDSIPVSRSRVAPT